MHLHPKLTLGQIKQEAWYFVIKIVIVCFVFSCHHSSRWQHKLKMHWRLRTEIQRAILLSHKLQRYGPVIKFHSSLDISKWGSMTSCCASWSHLLVLSFNVDGHLSKLDVYECCALHNMKLNCSIMQKHSMLFYTNTVYIYIYIEREREREREREIERERDRYKAKMQFFI